MSTLRSLRSPFARELLEQVRQYALLMRLHRPIGIWLLLWPTLWALWIAASGHPSPRIFVIMVLGVVVVRSAGCVINDYADRHVDPFVTRTRDRPLATGRVTAAEALVLFVALGLVAVALALKLNVETQKLAAVGALLTVVYPYSKRVFGAPQLLLGLAFGWSVPMAFAAQTVSTPPLAWLLCLTVIVWTLIFDTQYAMADRAEDAPLGIKSTALLFGQADVFLVALLMVVFLLALILVGRRAHLGVWYGGGVGAAGLLLARQWILIRDREPARCFEAFMNHQVVGASVFAGLMLDYTFRG